MIIADTNVLSEPLRLRPDRRVVEWLAEHASGLAISTITVGELEYGVNRLPDGRRKSLLTEAVAGLVTAAGDRIFPYDATAAGHYARLRATRELAGRTVGVEDTMIAGICLAGGHDVATRNVRHFEDAGVVVHNPWEHHD